MARGIRLSGARSTIDSTSTDRYFFNRRVPKRRTICTGPENVIELIPRTDQKYSITRIAVSLTRPKTGEREYRFGADVLLRFSDGREAVWEFAHQARD